MSFTFSGLNRLRTKLNKKQRSIGQKNVEYVVGNTANYAIYVHERNLNYRVGQWKYLEEPARRQRKEIIGVAKSVIANGGTLDEAIAMAALRLQREAQKLTPVDTGHLKASTVTRKVK